MDNMGYEGKPVKITLNHKIGYVAAVEAITRYVGGDYSMVGKVNGHNKIRKMADMVYRGDNELLCITPFEDLGNTQDSKINGMDLHPMTKEVEHKISGSIDELTKKLSTL